MGFVPHRVREGEGDREEINMLYVDLRKRTLQAETDNTCSCFLGLFGSFWLPLLSCLSFQMRAWRGQLVNGGKPD